LNPAGVDWGGGEARSADATAFAHRSKPMLVNVAAFY
jgi:hypothetical protein